MCLVAGWSRSSGAWTPRPTEHVYHEGFFCLLLRFLTSPVPPCEIRRKERRGGQKSAEGWWTGRKFVKVALVATVSATLVIISTHSPSAVQLMER